MPEMLFKQQTRDERQEEARVKWIKSKCKGTFEFATGFGKTWIWKNLDSHKVYKIRIE